MGQRRVERGSRTHYKTFPFGILKPTAPTAHAASLLLQALRDKGNAGALTRQAAAE